MSNSHQGVNSDLLEEIEEAARLGMSLSGIASIMEVSPSRLYEYLRLGDASAALIERGYDDDGVGRELECSSAFARMTRSVFEAIERGRMNCERDTLVALDHLVRGVGKDDPIPVIPGSLSAIKLRLALISRSGASEQVAASPTEDVVIEQHTTSRIRLDDLQRLRDRALEASKQTALPDVIEADSVQLEDDATVQ